MGLGSLVKSTIILGLGLYMGYKIGSCTNPNEYLTPKAQEAIEEVKTRVGEGYGAAKTKIKEFYQSGTDKNIAKGDQDGL